MMLTQLASHAAMTYPGWDWGHGPGAGFGGPGWWLIFPILFWTLVLSGIGYVIYRRSPKQQARISAERTLAERYARGEITEDELQQRRNVIRTKP